MVGLAGQFVELVEEFEHLLVALLVQVELHGVEVLEAEFAGGLVPQGDHGLADRPSTARPIVMRASQAACRWAESRDSTRIVEMSFSVSFLPPTS